MLTALVAALVLAAPYWLFVPARLRQPAVAGASLAALATFDLRVALVVLAVAGGVFGQMRLAGRGRQGVSVAFALLGLCALALLFVWNKRAAPGSGPLPSQPGVALLGTSYLVLKAAGLLIETAREPAYRGSFAEVLGWLVFLPTFPSGPMEDFEHFRTQRPAFDQVRVFGGLERILIGLLKAIVDAEQLGRWAAPIVASPHEHGAGMLLLALYAVTVRFYLDFSGFSDVAIGLGALFGYEIEENFDHPLVRRNLTQLWQRWHMTLTRWLRLYLFVPVTRALMRHDVGDRPAAATGQLAAMIFCGLWHGLQWNFVVWGLLNGLGLVWVGILARDLGRRLPETIVRWWRRSVVAYTISMALTFNVFALFVIFVVTDVPGALAYLRRLVGA